MAIDNIRYMRYGNYMITDADIQKMKKVFATKDDLPRSLREELEAQKPEWVRVITETVTKALGDKIDLMYVKLDKFIGDIKDKREVQEMHQGDHDRMSTRLDRLEKKTNLSPFVD